MLLWAPSARVSAEDWTQWSGNDRQGRWNESGILDRFPEGGLKPAWVTPIGSGYSGPVVADGRVYTLGYDADASLDRVFCFDAVTGKELWRHEYPAEIWDNAHDGGTLTLRTRREGPVLPAPSAVEGSEVEGDTWVAIDIKDTGIGVPPEAQKKIFRIGFSDWGNGQKGSGLGLYVARRNIENHDGRIEIASAVGKGATVTVRLPIQSGGASPDATSVQTPQSTQDFPLGG